MTKYCCRCQRYLPLADFTYNKSQGRYKSECRKCDSERAVEYFRRLPPEKRAAKRRRAQLRKYGLTPYQYRELLNAFDHQCAVCGSSDRTLHVDHCHDTNRVRGILCAQCNQALGLAGDDPELLRQLADYLEQPPAYELDVRRQEQLAFADKRRNG